VEMTPHYLIPLMPAAYMLGGIGAARLWDDSHLFRGETRREARKGRPGNGGGPSLWSFPRGGREPVCDLGFSCLRGPSLGR
jgi:hypothetical protein